VTLGSCQSSAGPSADSAPSTIRVGVACMVGTAVEFYDFYIYGTASALVFPTVFFPGLSAPMAAVASMGTFATAFVSRPLGGAVFGHFGDRLGRRQTLVATLLLMGLSTVAVGLVPSAASIGVAAPLIVVFLRLLQGFAAGGEWAGSALLGTEHAPSAHRGRFGMFTTLGTGVAFVLTGLTFLAVNSTVGEASTAFLTWGWRVPFVLSAVLIAFAFYVRVKVDESPVFTAEQFRNPPTKAPIAECIRRQSGKLVLVTGSFLAVFAFVFMASVFLVSYAQIRLGLPKSAILGAGVWGGITWCVVVVVAATISDRLGRRPVIVFGWLLGLPWSFVAIELIDTGDPAMFTVAVVGLYGIVALAIAPLPAFIAELFPTRYRYTSTALALNTAGIFGGAVPPLIAGPLLDAHGPWTVALMMAGFALISLLATCRLPETNGASLTGTTCDARDSAATPSIGST
jgi:MFS family permease